MSKLIKISSVIFAVTIILSGCTAAADGNGENEQAEAIMTVSLSADDIIDSTNIFTDRDLNFDYTDRNPIDITLKNNASHCDSTNVDINNNTITIKAEGVYVLNGSLSDGQIIVNADDTAKIQLVLNGVDINCNTSAAIYCKSAHKLFVTTTADSKLTNKNEFVAIDDEDIDAVIYSKSDLTLNGSKKLGINASYGNCVVSNDDLTIASGEYDFTAENHTIKANDSVAITNAALNLTAGKDGIHSKNDDVSKGFVYIKNGDITINAEDEGIQSSSAVKIAGGNLNIQKSNEGIEARFIDISGGTISIIADDDGMNAVDKSETTDSTNQTAEQTDNQAPPQGERNGDIPTPPDNMPDNESFQPPSDMPENGDAQPPSDIPDNESAELPSDMPESENGKFKGDMQGFGKGQMDGGKMDMMSSSSTDCSIVISGGSVTINADADGMDSNGIITISGGETIVYGAENDGDSAIDYETQLTITGGKIIALGMSGMAEGASASSTQCSILYNMNAKGAANDVIQLSDGNTALAEITAVKSYNSIFISCPEIADNKKYTIKAGDTEEKIKMDGTNYSNSQRQGFGFGMRGNKPQMQNEVQK